MSDLRVVGEDLGDRQGTVTIEGPTQESVNSAEAKQLAITTGSKKISRCGVSGNESVYPVNSDGESPDSMVLSGGDVVAYRCEYKLTGGL